MSKTAAAKQKRKVLRELSDSLVRANQSKLQDDFADVASALRSLAYHVESGMALDHTDVARVALVADPRFTALVKK
jgi:hypothetical protein